MNAAEMNTDFALESETQTKSAPPPPPTWFVHGAQGGKLARRFLAFKVNAPNAEAAKNAAAFAAVLDRTSIAAERFGEAAGAIWVPVETAQTPFGLVLLLTPRRA